MSCSSAGFKDAAEELCDGRAAPLVLALVQGNRFSADELARLRRLLDEAAGRSAAIGQVEIIAEQAQLIAADSRIAIQAEWGHTPMLVWFAETTIVAGIWPWWRSLASRLRPIGPSVRHALWLVVLIKLITPPLVSWPWAAPIGGASSGPHSGLKPLVPPPCRKDRRPSCWCLPRSNKSLRRIDRRRARYRTDRNRRRQCQRWTSLRSGPYRTRRDRERPSRSDCPPRSCGHLSLPDRDLVSARVAVGWLVVSVILAIGQVDPDRPVSPPAVRGGCRPPTT